MGWYSPCRVGTKGNRKLCLRVPPCYKPLTQAPGLLGFGLQKADFQHADSLFALPASLRQPHSRTSARKCCAAGPPTTWLARERQALWLRMPTHQPWLVCTRGCPTIVDRLSPAKHRRLHGHSGHSCSFSCEAWIPVLGRERLLWEYFLLTTSSHSCSLYTIMVSSLLEVIIITTLSLFNVLFGPWLIQ